MIINTVHIMKAYFQNVSGGLR